MALIRIRGILHHPQFISSCSCGSLVAPAIQRNVLISDHGSKVFINKSSEIFQPLDVFYRWATLQHLSTSVQPGRICWEGSSGDILLRKLEITLKHHQVEEAWVTFHDFISLYGFPAHSVVSRLITELSYSSDHHWLQKACDLVLKISKEKSSLLRIESLCKLLLSLARAQMPIPASMILRVMIETEKMPPMNVLCMVVSHMVKSEIGTCLAANVLVQICDCFVLLSAKGSDHLKLTKPDTMIFNLVLDACLRCELFLKGQQMVELMSKTGIIADAHSIIIISQIHEMNGQRDEIKKFKHHIDRLPSPFVCKYQKFYDSLLRIHFKFDDLDSAAKLVLDMHTSIGYIPNLKSRETIQKPCFIPIGSHYLKAGLKLQIAPELWQTDSILTVEQKQDLVISRNGRLVLSNKALAKLIIGYKRQGRVTEVSKLLLSIQKDYGTLDGQNLCSNVINACIQLGWLESAHDILDDMEVGGVPIGSTTYMALLTAYSSKDMLKEAKALLRQMRKTGLAKHFSDEMDISMCLVEAASSSVCNSSLSELLVQEMGEEEKAIPPSVYELNSSIYFFCKAKMMGDAVNTYQRMKQMQIQMTEQTFAYLISGYSSQERYRDITILWGDVKRHVMSRNLILSRDLYELFLMSFLHGGYFERVMEIISCMKELRMYIDKWVYKSVFLKLHKNLYKSLKASDAKTDAQRKRIQYVQTFRKWAGID